MAILIRNNFDCTVEESIVESNGKFFILQVTVLLGGKPTLVINIYTFGHFFKPLREISWTKLKILLLEEILSVL